MGSKFWGHLGCPDCDLEVCVHEEGWHVGSDPESDDFDKMSEFVREHTASHRDDLVDDG